MADVNSVELLIINCLKQLLESVEIEDFQFEVEKNELMEATAIRAETDERINLIKAEVRESTDPIYIPNIMLPSELRYQGLGKRMIWFIFKVGRMYGYSVYLTMLTDSFRQRMLNRGALPTYEHDVLQIVDNTNLRSERRPL